MKKLIAAAVASSFMAMAVIASPVINEKFSSDPLQNGWRIFGASSLFVWDATNQAVDVTWDSTQPNSYFYKPLGVTLTTNDSFCIQFDLRITNAVAYGYGQELAIGLLHWSDATNADFSRTAGYSPNVYEFDYFPAFSADGFSVPNTVTETIVDSAADYDYFSDAQSLLTGVTYHVVLLHYADSIGISGVIYTNSQIMSTFPAAHNYYATNENGSFVLDTLSITSYADDGYGDDIFAQGSVANLSWATPLPVGLVQTPAAGHIQFASDTNWLYTLEQSSDFKNWSPAAPLLAGTGTNLILQATNPPPDKRFYRVRADLP